MRECIRRCFPRVFQNPDEWREYIENHWCLYARSRGCKTRMKRACERNQFLFISSMYKEKKDSLRIVINYA